MKLLKKISDKSDKKGAISTLTMVFVISVIIELILISVLLTNLLGTKRSLQVERTQDAFFAAEGEMMKEVQNFKAGAINEIDDDYDGGYAYFHKKIYEEGDGYIIEIEAEVNDVRRKLVGHLNTGTGGGGGTGPGELPKPPVEHTGFQYIGYTGTDGNFNYELENKHTLVGRVSGGAKDKFFKDNPAYYNSDGDGNCEDESPYNWFKFIYYPNKTGGTLTGTIVDKDKGLSSGKYWEVDKLLNNYIYMGNADRNAAKGKECKDVSFKIPPEFTQIRRWECQDNNNDGFQDKNFDDVDDEKDGDENCVNEDQFISCRNSNTDLTCGGLFPRGPIWKFTYNDSTDSIDGGGDTGMFWMFNGKPEDMNNQYPFIFYEPNRDLRFNGVKEGEQIQIGLMAILDDDICESDERQNSITFEPDTGVCSGDVIWDCPQICHECDQICEDSTNKDDVELCRDSIHADVCSKLVAPPCEHYAKCKNGTPVSGNFLVKYRDSSGVDMTPFVGTVSVGGDIKFWYEEVEPGES